MRSATGASRGFTIFAISMVIVLVLGTIVVFGGALFGTGTGEPSDEPETVQQEVEQLETAVAENPDDVGSMTVLASIYVDQGNFSDAIALYERATRISPEDGNLRLTFGLALMRSGNILDARVQLEKAVELMPDSAGPPYYLGQLEQSKTEPDEEAARMWYERAIEAAPDSMLAAEAQNRINEIDGIVPTATPAP